MNWVDVLQLWMVTLEIRTAPNRGRLYRMQVPAETPERAVCIALDMTTYDFDHLISANAKPYPKP